MEQMINVGIPVLAGVCLVLYLMRRKGRLKSEE
jgi:hypothetical protein